MNPRLIAMILSAALAACTPRPEDSPVLSWSLGQSDRESVRTAGTSDEKDIDTDYTANPAVGVSIKFHVHGRTAMLAFTEDGKEVAQRAPVALEVMAADASDYTLTAVGCMGPHYIGVQPNPEDMVLACMIKATKSDHEHMAQLWVHADGRVDNGKLDGMQ